MILIQEDRPALSVWAEEGRWQRTWAAVANARAIDLEALRIWFAVRHKMPTSRAAETIVSRIQFEPTGGNNPFFRGWFAPCRNDGFNPARFQLGEDTRYAVARVQRGDCDCATRHVRHVVESRQRVTVMNTACGHFDVENHALSGVDRRLLLVGRLDPRQTTPLSQRGDRIAVDERNRRWCSDGFEIGCDNGDKCGLPSHWTAVIVKL